MSLPDDYLRALGRITVNFAHLEFEISFLIWRLLDADQEAARVVADSLSFREKCELIHSLCKLRITDKKGVRDLGLLVKNLERAGKERNRLIHSVWGTGGARVFSRQRKALVNVKIEELKLLGDYITEVNRQVNRFKGTLIVRFPGLLELRRNPWSGT